MRAQPRSNPGTRLVPMGQLAAAVGVAPGTATTMVKTLAESGLVEYEPYAGVALTAGRSKSSPRWSSVAIASSSSFSCA
jgi:Mn-dependent DtxR family transcriptional regulator